MVQLRARQKVAAAVAVVATSALVTAGCVPNPPTSGPGSPGYRCFNVERTDQIAFSFVPGQIASITTGATICTQNNVTILSIAAYASMNKKGYGRSFQVDEGLDSVGNVAVTAKQAQWQATFHAYNCVGPSWLGLVCSGNTQVHVVMSYTPPLAVGFNGTYIYETGNKQIDVDK